MCTFLGKEVSRGVEFPRVNDIEAFKVRIKALRAMAVRRALVKTLWLGAGVLGVGAFGMVLWQQTMV